MIYPTSVMRATYVSMYNFSLHNPYLKLVFISVPDSLAEIMVCVKLSISIYYFICIPVRCVLHMTVVIVGTAPAASSSDRISDWISYRGICRR
ncbi:hypothetical protein QBC47DRAFT_371709 [Echria macrotheca]|uniref:Uncharacterized protein n=1 Tax=Echria macrotheca TaxID=438768 RepID=A0AAJ0F8R2_9PEZI|nr:hypothetical protein QBC47DRAFT_371709 [Echria macrotheca]